MASEEPLFERDPTGRFSERGEAYRRFRPSYPAPAIDAVLDGLGPVGGVRCADVGAGTGISARLLADRGVRVWGVEPNAAMRAQAERHPLVTWVDGTAEQTTLGGACVDLVLCAQAFHWFEPTAALAEFARILRPGGRLALVWNDRDESDACTRVYGDLLREASGNDPAMESHTCPEPLYGSARFRDVRALEFEHEQVLDGEGLVGRAMSASYAPKDGPRHAAMVEGLRRLHATAADPSGVMRLRYITRVFLGTLGTGT